MIIETRAEFENSYCRGLPAAKAERGEVKEKRAHSRH